MDDDEGVAMVEGTGEGPGRSAAAGHEWHRALVRSLLGVDHPELGVQSVPDPAAVVRWLNEHGLTAAVREAAHTARATGDVWPGLPPAGLSPAQFLAALQRIRAELELLGTPTLAPTGSPRGRPDPEEQRLRADIPPHHGLL